MLDNEENVEVAEDIESEVFDSFNDDLDIPVEENKEEETLEVETPSEENEESKEVVEEVKEPEVEEATETKEELTTLEHFEGNKEVTKEELKQLGQKGLDYDRVKGQVQELRPTHDRLEKLSKLYEYENIDKFIDDMYSGYDQKKADEDNVSPESIKFDREADEKNELADEKLSQINTKENEQAEYTEFLSKYKDVDIDTIKPETWVEVQNGKTLSQAYENQLKSEETTSYKSELELLKKEMAILKTQNGNATKTPDGIGTKTDSNKQESYLAVWDD